MIAFGKEGGTPRAGGASLAPGFGLTNRVVIDQHFRQRDRLGRLLAALAYNPFAVGIGLDEDTAAFIDPDDGSRWWGRAPSPSSTSPRSPTRRWPRPTRATPSA
jgi:cyanophycinase